MSLSGGGQIDEDTFVGEASYTAAVHAAGGACEMVRALVRGDAEAAFCGLRPSGHHAGRDRAMGFCLFNNVAIAAELAIRELGLERVFILDWDVHHGNGTADVLPPALRRAVREHPPSRRLPRHRRDRRTWGRATGLGYTINAPVPHGADEEMWVSVLEHVIIPAALEFRPQLILISAGFDGHSADPLAGCALEARSYAQMTAQVMDLAARVGAPVGAVLEGGYELKRARRQRARDDRRARRADSSGIDRSRPAHHLPSRRTRRALLGPVGPRLLCAPYPAGNSPGPSGSPTAVEAQPKRSTGVGGLSRRRRQSVTTGQISDPFSVLRAFRYPRAAATALREGRICAGRAAAAAGSVEAPQRIAKIPPVQPARVAEHSPTLGIASRSSQPRSRQTTAGRITKTGARRSTQQRGGCVHACVERSTSETLPASAGADRQADARSVRWLTCQRTTGGAASRSAQSSSVSAMIASPAKRMLSRARSPAIWLPAPHASRTTMGM